MHEKDSYQFQRERVVRLAQEVAPGKTVTFDETITGIKFRIGDGVASPEFHPVSVLADKSDSWLRELIKKLAN